MADNNRVPAATLRDFLDELGRIAKQWKRAALLRCALEGHRWAFTKKEPPGDRCVYCGESRMPPLDVVHDDHFDISDLVSDHIEPEVAE